MTMKSFVTYILEKLEGSTKLTIEWMKEHYGKYNKELFNNELPSNIELGFVRKGESALGLQGFNKEFIIWKDKLKNGMYQSFITKTGKSPKYKLSYKGSTIVWDDDRYIEVKNCAELDPYIKMNPMYDFSDFQKEDTLIHEMIHLWVSKDGLEPKRSHGKEFNAKCKEIREKAKKLYGVEYQLGTTAKHEDTPDKDFQISDEWKEEIKKDIEKSAERGGGVLGMIMYFNKEKMPRDSMNQIKMLRYTKRFIFTTVNDIDRLLRQAKAQQGIEKIILVSTEGYIAYCNKYGKFKTMKNVLRFWDLNEYDEKLLLGNKLSTIDDINESINEGLGDWFNKIKNKIMSVFVKIKGGTPTSAINLEDYISDIETDEDEEQEGCEATNKKIIDGK